MKSGMDMRHAIRTPCFGLMLLGVLAQGAMAATIERFSPQGEIRSVRQMAARFTEDMVKFGDPKALKAVNCWIRHMSRRVG